MFKRRKFKNLTVGKALAWAALAGAAFLVLRETLGLIRYVKMETM